MFFDTFTRLVGIHLDFSKPFEMDPNSLWTRWGCMDWLEFVKCFHNWLTHHRQRLLTTCQSYHSELL